MNELKIFESPIFGQVRILEDEESNQPLFNALDVCNALGMTNNRKAIADHVDTPDVTKRYAWVVTGKKADGTDAKRKTSMTFVTESGLYSLIFGSKLERAKEFKRWVTSEVLPAIRKDGGYMMVRQEESDEDLMARAWAVAMKTLKRREERIKQLKQESDNKQQLIEERDELIETQEGVIAKRDDEIKELSTSITKMQPKVDYLDTILASTDTVPISNIAQDYGYSAKKFNVLLRNYNIQRKVGGTWVLYAKYLPEGYVQSKTFTYQKANGGQGSRSYTEWTQKGRIFLYNFLKEKGILPAIEKPQQTESANTL